MGKIMFTLSLPKTVIMDEDSFLDMLTGNSWFEWVIKVERHDYSITITMDDPDGDGEVTSTISVPDMIKILKSLPTDQLWARNLIEEVLDDDVDSNSQDLFWQYAVYGDIVFG